MENIKNFDEFTEENSVDELQKETQPLKYFDLSKISKEELMSKYVDFAFIVKNQGFGKNVFITNKEILTESKYYTNDENMLMEMAFMNLSDNSQSEFNPDKYRVLIKNKEGKYRVLHFHVLSKSENWEIKLYIIDGELYQVENYGNRKDNDVFSDIVKLAKLWLNKKSTIKGLSDKTNREVLEIQWRIMNPDNEIDVNHKEY